MNAKTINIFVYGSLKKGYGNSNLLKTSEFLGTYMTTNRYGMVSFGSFPALIHYGNHTIQGEMYSITPETLVTLDALEGNGSFYQREVIDVEGFGEALCYFLIDVPLEAKLNSDRIVPYKDGISWASTEQNYVDALEDWLPEDGYEYQPTGDNYYD